MINELIRSRTEGIKDPPVQETEYVYSEKLKAFVSSEPLKVDDTVVKAASTCGINLSWDDEGRVNNISLIDARKLTEVLGVSLLSPSEYWKLLEEAHKNGNQLLLEELQSNQYAEWLDVVYQKDESGNTWAIEHPQIIPTKESYTFEGNKVRVDVPTGRPGWFSPVHDINVDTGIPHHIDTTRGKGTESWSSNTWKFWSFYNCDQGIPVSPIRNWVISSGTPSLDMDLPVFASEEALMIRVVRKKLSDPPVEQKLIDEATILIQTYLTTTVDKPAVQNPQDHERFYQHREDVFKFLKTHGRQFIGQKDKKIRQISDQFIDMLGEIWIMASAKGEEDVVIRTNTIAHELLGTPDNVDSNSFINFIKGTQSQCIDAMREKKKIVFVMGHKNPDTDTAVSALFEAYRNSLLDNEAAYIPVIQGERIPDEIRRLLGDEIADSVILTNSDNYKQALKSGQARWILVDQNTSDVQRFAISIIDHHLLSEKTKRQDVSKTWEMVGSTSALVMQKFYGMGVELDAELARIMYGATLMDTEDRSERKMTYKDGIIMGLLQQRAQLTDEQVFFQDLMSYLLNTDDARLLFERDYKQDWGIFGFAVAKVKGAFNNGGEVIKKDLLDTLVQLGIANNKAKNFPLTVIKVADYVFDNETVNKERIYLLFNDYVLPEFKETMVEFISQVITHEFEGRAKILVRENYIDYSGVGDQLSRKVTAPYLEPLVNAFNEFYYSPATGLYVSREMLKVNQDVSAAARTLGIPLTWDKAGRVNNITFDEAKMLLTHMGYTMMSVSEYWQILSEAKAIHDEQLTAHLKSKGFVEFMDTIIINGKQIINHPQLVEGEDGFEYEGNIENVDIPAGLPGLIYEKDINVTTGFPNKIYPPTHYGDKTMMRYWSPDASRCIPTRGYIFLLGQAAFDCKIHPDDAFPQLGIRPCTYNVKPPHVTIINDAAGVHAVINRS